MVKREPDLGRLLPALGYDRPEYAESESKVRGEHHFPAWDFTLFRHFQYDKEKKRHVGRGPSHSPVSTPKYPSNYNYRSSPIQLKREPVLFLKRFYFSVGSTNQGSSQRLPSCPLPGQKSIRLAKKGGGSSFPDAGFRRFRPAIPWPPRLFAETKRGELRRFLPALFGFGACFLARATRKRV